MLQLGKGKGQAPRQHVEGKSVLLPCPFWPFPGPPLVLHASSFSEHGVLAVRTRCAPQAPYSAALSLTASGIPLQRMSPSATCALAPPRTPPHSREAQRPSNPHGTCKNPHHQSRQHTPRCMAPLRCAGGCHPADGQGCATHSFSRGQEKKCSRRTRLPQNPSRDNALGPEARTAPAVRADGNCRRGVYCTPGPTRDERTGTRASPHCGCSRDGLCGRWRWARRLARLRG